MIAKCFKCSNDFDSQNPEDEYGDGVCSACLEKGKRIAFEVDIKMAKLRRDNPYQRPESAELIQEMLAKPEGTRLNARDLGIIV